MTTTASSGPSHADGPDDVWRAAGQAFERWVDDDADGLSDLVAIMTPVLWQVVRAYGLSRDVAEDVIQSTWLALVRRRSSILDPGAIGGWLTITARREAWRSAKAQRDDLPAEQENLDAHLPRQRSAEGVVMDHDRSERIWHAVDSLPARCQRLLRVVAFENRPDYSSLAEDLGMPVGSIGPTRGRCLTKLRVALIEAGEV